MKISWSKELPQWVALVVMLALAVVLWPIAPDRMPTHWNAAGEVDGYSGKAEGLLLLPLMAVGLYVLLLVLPRVDPLRANYTRFTRAYLMMRTAITLFLALIYGVILLNAFGWAVDVAQIVVVAMGSLLVVLGLALRDVAPNWFVGIRTPWTLSSERSWARTHQLGGWIFALLGASTMVLGLESGPRWIGWMVIPFVSAMAALVLYSFLVWRADPGRSRT